MSNVATAWSFNIERGPSCLYVQPVWENRQVEGCADRGVADHQDAAHESADLIASDQLAHEFADHIWQAMMQHLTFRLVLEMDDVRQVSPALKEQLCLLRDKIENHSGLMKLVGLSSQARDELTGSGTVKTVAKYDSRYQAMMSGCATRPK